MRIKDLLEAPFTTNVRTVSARRKLGSYRNRPSNLPSGNFSAVKNDPEDPHMVRKFSIKSRDPIYGEGFKAFITYILKNGFQENVHMPRVYDIKTVKGSDGYEIDSYRIEKLIPMTSIPKQELISYVEMVMDNSDIGDDYSIDNIAHILADEINIAVEEFQPYFKLESLNEACKIVAMALQATNGNNDVSSQNLMFRRTSNGLQIVFSDPVYISS